MAAEVMLVGGSREKGGGPALPLSATDYHILMVLAGQDLYGYAIMKAIEADSGGAVAPGIGSLYRILARLTALGWVAEVDAPGKAPAEHPGHPRQYYRLTREGRAALRDESRRLESVLQLARERKLLPGESR
jgi:PadR family transcriptional regulator, regulatory protein PadR